MAEAANTQGLHSFEYPKGYSPKSDDELKKAIREAYDESRGRKRREKIKKIAYWAITALAILALLVIGYIVTRK